MYFDGQGVVVRISEKSELKWESYGYFSVRAWISRWIGSISDPIRLFWTLDQSLESQNPTHTHIHTHLEKDLQKTPQKVAQRKYFFYNLVSENYQKYKYTFSAQP